MAHEVTSNVSLAELKISFGEGIALCQGRVSDEFIGTTPRTASRLCTAASSTSRHHVFTVSSICGSDEKTLGSENDCTLLESLFCVENNALVVRT